MNSFKKQEMKGKTSKIITAEILEDPRYKEYEPIPIEKFKQDRDKAQKEYEKLENDLNNLKDEYEDTKKRALAREAELRAHINALLLKYRTRDTKKNLENINNLKDEILENIRCLEDQSKQDIRQKKKDMETKIKLRLVDSEINYNRELEKKVKDQESVVSKVDEFTKEMEKIKLNYNSIKEKVDKYIKDNNNLKKEIMELDFKNEDLKNEIMKLKYQNKKLGKELEKKNKNNNILSASTKNNFIDNKDKNDNNNNKVINNMEDFDDDEEDELNKKSKINAAVKDKFENMQKEKLTSKMKNQFSNLSNDFNKYLSQNPNNNKEEVFSIDKIADLLNNKEFINKYYRECSVISSLLNIYEKTDQKIKQLDNEYRSLKDHHPLYDRIVEIIQAIKAKEMNDKLKSVNQLSKRVVNELLGNFVITMKKDQRKELIETIVSDSEINRLIFDEKLPNILNRDRQIGY